MKLNYKIIKPKYNGFLYIALDLYIQGITYIMTYEL